MVSTTKENHHKTAPLSAMIKPWWSWWCVIIAGFSLFSGCSGTMPSLGIHDKKLSECPAAPHCVNSQSVEGDHFVEPLMLTGSSIEVREKILTVLDTLAPITVTLVEEGYIRAEARSRLFRFVDDLEFYFPDTADQPVTVHVRSASRVGYTDLGVNRQRVENLRQLLQSPGSH